MAEQYVIVCDVCGAPATAVVSLTVHGARARDGQKLTKDLCDKHLSDLVSNARRPRRGRRRGAVAPAAIGPIQRQRPKAAAAAPQGASRRRGRPRGTAESAGTAEAAAG